MGSSSTKSLLSVSEVIDKVAEPKAKNPIGHPKKEVDKTSFFGIWTFWVMLLSDFGGSFRAQAVLV